MKGNERKMKMIVKGISRKIFRKIVLESCPTVHLGGRPMIVSDIELISVPNYSIINVVVLLSFYVELMMNKVQPTNIYQCFLTLVSFV